MGSGAEPCSIMPLVRSLDSPSVVNAELNATVWTKIPADQEVPVAVAAQAAAEHEGEHQTKMIGLTTAPSSRSGLRRMVTRFRQATTLESRAPPQTVPVTRRPPRLRLRLRVAGQGQEQASSKVGPAQPDV